MNNRYEEVPESVQAKLTEVRENYFPELRNAKVKVLYDKKKRISAGVVTLACILRPNELIKHFTADEARGLGDGYDYIIILDKVCWENCHGTDQEKILRHELRHVFVDIEADSPYKLVEHEVSDFYEEMELNKNDPRWKQRLALLTEDIYAQQKEDAKGRTKRTGKGKLAYGPTPLEVVDAEKRAIKEA